MNQQQYKTIDKNVIKGSLNHCSNISSIDCLKQYYLDTKPKQIALAQTVISQLETFKPGTQATNLSQRSDTEDAKDKDLEKKYNNQFNSMMKLVNEIQSYEEACVLKQKDLNLVIPIYS